MVRKEGQKLKRHQVYQAKILLSEEVVLMFKCLNDFFSLLFFLSHRGEKP